MKSSDAVLLVTDGIELSAFGEKGYINVTTSNNPFMSTYLLSVHAKFYNFYFYLLSYTLGSVHNKLVHCACFPFALRNFLELHILCRTALPKTAGQAVRDYAPHLILLYHKDPHLTCGHI